MLIKKAADIASSEITPESLYLRRREFLKAAGVSAAAAVAGVFTADCGADAAQTGPKLNVAKKTITLDEKLTPFEDVTSYNNFYEFGVDKDDPARNSKNFKPKPWSMQVEGQCAKPGTYTLEDILKPHPLEERVYRMRCVEAWSMIIPWVGFPLSDLLKRFEPNGNAKFVEFTTIMRPEEMPGQRQRFLRSSRGRTKKVSAWTKPCTRWRSWPSVCTARRCRILTARRSGWSCRGSTASRESSRSTGSASWTNSL